MHVEKVIISYSLESRCQWQSHGRARKKLIRLNETMMDFSYILYEAVSMLMMRCEV